MSHKIFLSHNHADKPVVEPVALRLREIFGQDHVFYDAWSIQPGDGIIDQMNRGLSAPEFVFFFVSAKSLASGMVKLEWQNALYAASKGKTRIIPVRVDGSLMPPLLMQTLYIDMHTVGLEAALAQIVSVTQGNASFTPQHAGFSNLTHTSSISPDGILDIVVRASHLLEPKPSFLLLLGNKEGDFTVKALGYGGYNGGFTPSINFNGVAHNVQLIRPMGATLSPQHPIRLQLSPIGNTKIDFRGVMHEVAEDQWVIIPAA